MTVKIKFRIMKDFLDDLATILAEKVQNSLIDGGYVLNFIVSPRCARGYQFLNQHSFGIVRWGLLRRLVMLVALQDFLKRILPII